jgi:Bacterial toxin 23
MGDRFRTAAGFIGYGGVDIRLNMFTGDSYDIVEPAEDYKRGIKAGDGDMYRLGALSLGFKGQRIGWNSEGIRDLFQNKFAHEIVNPQAYFRRLAAGYPGSLYTSTTRFTNKYSLWTF